MTIFEKMTQTKRVHKELSQWTSDEVRIFGEPILTIDKDNDAILHIGLRQCSLQCENYPFRPPILTHRKMPTLGCCAAMTAMDPVVWMLAIAIYPPLKVRFPTHRIDCMCCHSLTCPTNWMINARLVHVACEALFCDLYDQLRGIRLPVDLPVDILRHIVFCI